MTRPADGGNRRKNLAQPVGIASGAGASRSRHRVGRPIRGSASLAGWCAGPGWATAYGDGYAPVRLATKKRTAGLSRPFVSRGRAFRTRLVLFGRLTSDL